MEFLTQNYINTSTQISVSSNTAVASNIFNRDEYYRYASSDAASDTTTSAITVTFEETTSVSRIAMLNTNVEGFTIYYNGATANTFPLDGDTTVSDFSGNTYENIYLRCSTAVACSSVTVEMKTTQTADQEKVLGLLYLGSLHVEVDRNPSAKSYRPKDVPKQVVHKMSDGGVRLHQVRKKKEINISLDYITESMKDDLASVFELQSPFNFAPFGTMTGWDGVLFEAVWDGPFNFYEFSDNARTSGFSGDILLKETSS